MAKKITKHELLAAIEKQGRFTAENGTRIFNGQFRSFSKDGDYINILDSDRGDAYRRIKLDTLKWVQVNGIKYNAEDITEGVEVQLGKDGVTINGHELRSIEAHELLLGSKLNSFDGFGLDGYGGNVFEINGRREIVAFEQYRPSAAENVSEAVSRLESRIADVRAAFAAKKIHKFVVGDVTFTEEVDPISRRCGIPDEGDKLTANLISSLPGAKISPMGEACCIACNEGQTFGFNYEGDLYEIHLSYRRVEKFEEFETVVRERYRACYKLIEEARNKGVKFSVRGIECVAKPYGWDEGFESCREFDEVFEKRYGIDLCSGSLTTHYSQYFKYKGRDIDQPAVAMPTTTAAFKQMVRDRVTFVLDAIKKIDSHHEFEIDGFTFKARKMECGEWIRVGQGADEALAESIGLDLRYGRFATYVSQYFEYEGTSIHMPSSPTPMSAEEFEAMVRKNVEFAKGEIAKIEAKSRLHTFIVDGATFEAVRDDNGEWFRRIDGTVELFAKHNVNRMGGSIASAFPQTFIYKGEQIEQREDHRSKASAAAFEARVRANYEHVLSEIARIDKKHSAVTLMVDPIA